LTWKEKLWVIGAHWGIEQKPWHFDEFRDAPHSLDVHRIYERLQEELDTLQEANTLVVSDFIRPTAERRALSPYVDPPSLN
jgi:hypothetical protein